MIQFEGVIKAYNDVNVVNNLSFKIKKGETFCLLGKSGSGKTTTLKMINRLIKNDSGNISLNGQNIDQVNEISLRRRIGYIIQNVGLFPHLTIENNISLPLKLAKEDKNSIQSRVHDLMDQIGLKQEEYLHRFPHELSGGQQQRIGIARAIAHRPEVLLMDEPFSALDPILREQMQSDFLHMEELKGLTKVIVTHDVNEAIRLGDTICVLDKGKKIFLGTPTEMLNSKDPLISDFLGDDRLLLKLKTLTLQDITQNLYATPADEESIELPPDTHPIALLNIKAKYIMLSGNTETFLKDEILLQALKSEV